MKPLVIYHANCADGFGAAFAAWTVLGEGDGIEEGAEYIPMQYGKTPDIEDFHMKYAVSQREVYILDFSLPKNVMDHLFEVAKRVVWLDHHKTALETWCGKYEKGDIYLCNRYGPTIPCEIVLNDNKSGAYLAWEYFHPGKEVPQFIRHIDDYDRWVFAIEGTKAFNKALWSYAPWSFDMWRDWLSGWSDDDGVGYLGHSTWLKQEGEAILRAHDQNVQSVVNGSARGVTIPTASVPTMWEMVANGLAANCPPHLTSDVGHELATQSGTYGLCWTLSQTDLVAKCSLRSNGDYDVSAIAKALGGGGHRNAAGFEVPIQTLLGWLK